MVHLFQQDDILSYEVITVASYTTNFENSPHPVEKVMNRVMNIAFRLPCFQLVNRGKKKQMPFAVDAHTACMWRTAFRLQWSDQTKYA